MEIDLEAELVSAKKLIKTAITTGQLQIIESQYLGRNGKVNDFIKKIVQLDKNNRKTAGASINRFKTNIISLILNQKKTLAEKQNKETVDITLPGVSFPTGTLHPISVAVREITSIFAKLGFIRMSYPEVEWEYFAFDALNMPKTHPARDDFETTFLNGNRNSQYGKMILTPHTSSGQIREMWRIGHPPIRMINIGKCYRPNWDTTHTPMFHQFEGLCVDSDINITHLKGTLDFFAREYFGDETKTRLRPHHFQFTEPSFEVDITCVKCGGTGKNKDSSTRCNICKSGWLELGGTGIVHPNVLRSGKIDPDYYSGWAFGFGIERVIMMKYGIDDTRSYYSGDLRFLEQF